MINSTKGKLKKSYTSTQTELKKYWSKPQKRRTGSESYMAITPTLGP